MKILPYILFVSSVVCADTLLFQDNFDGSPSAVLNNRTPDIGGAAWVAGDMFKGDGSVNGGLGTATLAFRPRAGNRYQLDVRFDCASTGTKWIGAGFSKGQSAEADHTKSRSMGRAWAILKGDPDQTTPNGNTAHANGTRNGAAFSGNLEVYPGEMDVRIVLDTHENIWTATWYAKRAEDAGFVLVRPTMELKDRNIDSVGFISNNGTGRFESFSLQSLSEQSDKPRIETKPLQKPESLGLITA